MNVEYRIANVEWRRLRRHSSSFAIRYSAFDIRSSFTLIELVVVLALLSTALSLVVFRLDGFSDAGRLRSAAAQLAAWVRLAQSEAAAAGVPRLLRFEQDSSRLVLHKPALRYGAWNWDEGASFELGDGVRIQRVVGEGTLAGSTHDSASKVRIDSEGRVPSHAVVLALHDRYAVLILRPFTEPRWVLTANPPQAREFDLLLTELALEENSTNR